MAGEDFIPGVLAFPGDPRAPAKEVCNCHCVLIERPLLDDEEVVDGKIVKRGNVALSAESDILKSGGMRLNLQQFGQKDLRRQTSFSIRKGIRSFRKRIAEHEDYINDPSSHDPAWTRLSGNEQKGEIAHWEKEINNFKESIKTREEELRKRGESL